MIVQALLTAVAVVLLLFLVLAAALAFAPASFGLLSFQQLGSPSSGSSSSSTTSNSAGTNSVTSSSGLGGTTFQYYVHVQPGAANLAGLLPPANSSKSASFGTMQLFAFNVTDMESSAAAVVGVMRGYTLQTGYVSGQSFLVEVEVLQYSNPETGVNGTLSIQGIVLNAPSTLAVVGGTGHFKGARGTCSISQLTSSVYHHLIEFL